MASLSLNQHMLFCFRDHCVVVGKDLLKRGTLIFRVDGPCRDAVYDGSVGWYKNLGALSETFKPFLMFLELCGFCRATY